jgi:hypothetical protein
VMNTTRCRSQLSSAVASTHAPRCPPQLAEAEVPWRSSWSALAFYALFSGSNTSGIDSKF